MQRISFRMSSLFACTIALAAAAAPALAQQYPWESADRAFVNQLSGSGNTATVEQVASQGNNIVEIYQGERDTGGYGNVAQAIQHGVGDSIIFLHQGGYQNQSLVFQSEGRNLQARVNMDSGWSGFSDGESNLALVEQSGFDTSAWIEQGHSSFSTAEIRQAGSNNDATIFQFGNSNHASIQQAGHNMIASINQDAGAQGNIATIRQGY